MSVYVLPAVVPGDTVESYGRRVIKSATAHVEEHDVYAVADEADVSVSRFNDVQGPALGWVQSVIGSTCERIREADVWDNMGTYDADDVLITDGSDAPDVASDLADTVQDADTYTDGWHETADGAVPVYTHERMVTFVDTLAYLEDVGELGFDQEYKEPGEVAGVALYMQAERICHATATEVAAVIRSAIQEGWTNV